MDFTPILQELQQKNIGARRYEREGQGKFRDSITIGKNGTVLFERYCYGEAAGLVCKMLAESVSPEGAIAWNYEACSYSGKDEAPKQLTGRIEEALEFDEKRLKWLPKEDLNRVPGTSKGLLGIFSIFKK